MSKANPPKIQISVQMPEKGARAHFLAIDLKKWARSALHAFEIPSAQLTLRVVGEVEGRSLNQQFRSKDYATNVLTFSLGETDAIEADIVLCLPVLLREAQAQKKLVRDHCAHLIVHGVLHALGFDHESDVDALEMENEEVQILAQLGIANPY